MGSKNGYACGRPSSGSSRSGEQLQLRGGKQIRDGRRRVRYGSPGVHRNGRSAQGEGKRRKEEAEGKGAERQEEQADEPPKEGTKQRKRYKRGDEAKENQ